MPILNLQKRFRELGRIRMGQQVATSKGGTRPDKLETFRLTSASRRLIEIAAAQYGGDVHEWESPSGMEWEVITDADSMPVIIPAIIPFWSQWYEQWGGGFRKRRCDGVTEDMTSQPCICKIEQDAGKELACQPVTRMSFALPEIPEWGVWRLESKGWDAATELSSIGELLQDTKLMWHATLRLDPRSRKVIVNNKPQTQKWMVPVIEDIDVENVVQALSGRADTVTGELTGGRVGSMRAISPPAPVERPGVGPPALLPSTGASRPPVPAGEAGVAPNALPSSAGTSTSKTRASRMRTAQQEATEARQQLDAEPGGAASGPDPAAQQEPSTESGSVKPSESQAGDDPASSASGGKVILEVCDRLGVAKNRAWLYLLNKHKGEFGDLRSEAKFLALEGDRLDRAIVLLEQEFGESE